MTYNAVFDESGKWKDCKMVVFAGLVGDPDELHKRFIPKWNSAIDKANLPGTRSAEGQPFFHTKALARSHKRATSPSERANIEGLFKDCAELICNSFVEGWANVIGSEDFARLPEKLRRGHRDPYYFAFEEGVTKLAGSVSFNANDKIQLICDDSEEYSLEALRCYRRLKRRAREVAKRVPAISFADDKDYAPLQAADLFAYCWRAERSGEQEGLWTEPFKMIRERFSEHTSTPMTA